MGSVVCSNEIEVLLEALVERLKALTPALTKATIVVPDNLFRSWLTHELASRGISVLDLEFLLIEELFERRYNHLLPLSFLPLLTSFFEKENCSIPVRHALLPFIKRAFFEESDFFVERESLWDRFVEWAKIKRCDLNLHALTYLFGFSSLNRAFFEEVSHSPLFKELFFLSPCMLYWGDQCSDRKVRYLLDSATQSSQKHLEKLLLDRQRFLANTGQMGQQFMLAIEDLDLPKEALYTLPKPLFKEPYQSYISTELLSKPCPTLSLLDHLKADMLLLVGKRDKSEELLQDPSIEIHAAYTPLREVEALYERVQNGCSLKPATVLVFVTEMSRYRAAFEEVFRGAYQIWGEEKRGGALSLFKMLISFFSSKSRSQDCVQLLRHELFQKILSIRSQDVEALISWLSRNPTAWGISEKYRHRYCEKRLLPVERGQSLSSCYEKYLGFFLQELKEDRTRIESSLLQPLGSFFAFIQEVEERCELPLEGKRAILKWRDFFSYLAQRIVRGNAYEEEALLLAQIEFERISVKSSSAKVELSEALRIFSAFIDRAMSHRSIDIVSPIIVAEFGSVQPFPVELVALLGLQENIFPRHDEDKLFSKMHRMVSASPVTNVGVDRYSVIEAILAAKNLFVGYQSYNFERRHSYSSVIDEMMHHLDEHYRIDGALPSKKLHTQHPLHRSVRVKKQEQKKGKDLYLGAQKEQEEIDLQNFCCAAFSPLKTFFREQYALHSDWRQEDPLFVRSKDVRKSFVKGAIEDGIKGTCISKELSRIEEGITLYDLHLLPTVSSAQIDGVEIFCPAVQKVAGSLSGIADKAIILFDEQWEKELFYRWPETVLRSLLAQEHGLQIAQKAYIVPENRYLSLKIADAKSSFAEWVHFFSAVKKEPFPFSYEIVQLLLKEKEGLYQAIADKAEREKGAWSIYFQGLSPTICEEHKSSWKRWAEDLWKEYFVSVEGK